MTTDSRFPDRSPLKFYRVSDGMGQHTNDSTGAKDMVKRDRFELLSAYLDGEVTAAESRQVEEWLANDPGVQCLYARLLKLRQGLKTIPVPAAQQSPEVVAQQVLGRLRRRSRFVWVFGGAAIAACAFGTLSGLLPGGESKLQLAQLPKVESIPATTTPVTPPTSPLMVALNNPVIEIPKAAVVSPEKPATLELPRPREVEQDIN